VCPPCLNRSRDQEKKEAKMTLKKEDQLKLSFLGKPVLRRGRGPLREACRVSSRCCDAAVLPPAADG
jgi:hypothetical protein